MKKLRHCVSCLVQSSGGGCCCCRGLSVTVLISGSVLHYILWRDGFPGQLAVMTVIAGDLSLTEQRQLAVKNYSRKFENVLIFCSHYTPSPQLILILPMLWQPWRCLEGTLVHLPYWSAGLTSWEYLYHHHQQSDTVYIHRTQDRKLISSTGRLWWITTPG